ncbi:hypothetical protein JCM11641_007437 [Rhodosporidiobolus odoratus]
MEHDSLPASAVVLEAGQDDRPLVPETPTQPREAAGRQPNEVDTTSDLIAGWLGGAVGVLVGNPFEVLKVRLQTGASSSSSPSPSSSSHSHSSPSGSSPRVGKSSIPPLPSPAFPFPPPPTPLPTLTAFSPAVASPSSHSSSTLRVPPHLPSVLSHKPSPLPQPAPTTSAATAASTAVKERVGLLSLYRTEGFRFFFAGTAGPILGLAFIDSAFFGLYGRAMQSLHQDRQDPSHLSRVALSGATAGALCALLETPIEVVKTRAQVESTPGAKLGSFKIASQIAKKEGLRGFYIGGLMTACHDGISSGIFFWGYFVFRRLLRGEHPFRPASSPSSSSSFPSTPLESLASPLSPLSTSSSLSDSSYDERRPPIPDETHQKSTSEGLGKGEVGRILLAGGLAGALSAVVPYPFDIVKTRLQTANFSSRARSSPISTSPSNFTSNATPFHTRPSSSSGSGISSALPPALAESESGKLTVRQVFRGIHAEGVEAYRYRYPSTTVYQMLANWVFPSSSARSSQSRRRAAGGGGGILNPKAEKWALRVLGFKGFTTGLGPTVVSSFVGSAATITTVELALHFMGVNGGGGGVG